MLDDLEKEDKDTIDIFGFVKDMRTRRVNMVQTPVSGRYIINWVWGQLGHGTLSQCLLFSLLYPPTHRMDLFSKILMMLAFAFSATVRVYSRYHSWSHKVWRKWSWSSSNYDRDKTFIRKEWKWQNRIWRKIPGIDYRMFIARHLNNVQMFLIFNILKVILEEPAQQFLTSGLPLITSLTALKKCFTEVHKETVWNSNVARKQKQEQDCWDISMYVLFNSPTMVDQNVSSFYIALMQWYGISLHCVLTHCMSHWVPFKIWTHSWRSVHCSPRLDKQPLIKGVSEIKKFKHYFLFSNVLAAESSRV